MFTGLIQEIGTIRAIEVSPESARVRIGAGAIMQDIARGESIAIDGCCLTVEEFDAREFSVFASAETLRCTTLGDRLAGDGVNLERALTLQQRLGGHLVSGHVDATGSVKSVAAVDGSHEIWFNAPAEIMALCVEKGSIAVDGISLTLVGVRDDTFSVWIIPETWTRTTISQRGAGARVNLEADLIAKHVSKMLGAYRGGGVNGGSLRKLLADESSGARG